jgi:hypothetical protein
MPYLQKSAVLRDFCLPLWVNSLHTLMADSFAIWTAYTNRSGQFVNVANSSKPPAHVPGTGSRNSCNTN